MNKEKLIKLLVVLIAVLLLALQALLIVLRLVLTAWDGVSWALIFLPMIIPGGLFILTMVFAVTLILLFNPNREDDHYDQ